MAMCAYVALSRSVAQLTMRSTNVAGCGKRCSHFKLLVKGLQGCYTMLTPTLGSNFNLQSLPQHTLLVLSGIPPQRLPSAAA